MAVSDRRIQELSDAGFKPNGIAAELKISIDRVLSVVGANSVREQSIERIRRNYTDEELYHLAKVPPGKMRRFTEQINFDCGELLKFGVISDTHYGSLYEDPEKTMIAAEHMTREGCQFVLHCGDITDGWPTKRDGSVFELRDGMIGFDPQVTYATRMLQQFPGTMYAITGNHDNWYKMSANANVGMAIEKAMPTNPDGSKKFVFLAYDRGEIIVSGIKIMLSHGNDATSNYATSYRLQKKISQIQGGKKPNMWFMGHAHKSIFIFERNIHGFQAGCLQDQSTFMESKGIAANVGYWIIEACVNNGEVVWIKPMWKPFYVE